MSHMLYKYMYYIYIRKHKKNNNKYIHIKNLSFL